jgi:flagellar biosynthesis/type III secretory pathway protein FliH
MSGVARWAAKCVQPDRRRFQARQEKAQSERKKAINAARRKQKKERKEQERRKGRKEGTGGILK